MRSRRSGSNTQAWLRTYQAPLWLGVAFIVLMILLALTPEPKPTAAERTVGSTQATPDTLGYAVCGIGKTFDPDKGKCVPLPSTPLPCIQGTKLDSKAGFCLPTGTPVIVAPAPVQPTLAPGQFPGGFGDLPGINNHPERDR